MLDRNETWAKITRDLPKERTLTHFADVSNSRISKRWSMRSWRLLRLSRRNPAFGEIKGLHRHTASVSGTGGDWGMTFNNAAKGAVVNLTRAPALDLGKKGVRINSVCPSLTRTGMTTDMMDDKELFSERISLAPRLLRRWPARSLITGANVAVDGGFPPPMVQPPQE